MSIFENFRIRKKIKAPWEKYYTKDQLNITIPDISMYDQVKEASLKYPTYIAYRYFDTSVNFKTFMEQVDKVAQSLKKMNVKKGDVITICSPNVPEIVIALYALNKIGAIASMLHPLSASEEIKDSLNATRSKYLIMIDLFYDKIETIIDKTTVKKVIFISPSDSMKPIMKIGYKVTKQPKIKKYPKKEIFISYKNFLKLSDGSNEVVESVGDKDTPAIILNSGGTSGKPKYVVLQNRAFVFSAIQELVTLKNLRAGDSLLAVMPNFHGFGLGITIHTALAIGGTTILVPQFDAKKFDTLFKKTKPTIVLGVPTLFEALISNPNEKSLDLSFLKYVICGGDSLTKKLEDRVNSYLFEHGSKVGIVQGYGLTEALAAVCLSCDEYTKSGSIGIPFPGNHIKIIDPSTRKPMKPLEVGEICVHSKAFMMGYLNNESETNDALQIHSDGHIWLHTGDLGYMDKDGYVFYQGRQKRMIVSSGYNVFPSHVEEIIEAHPAVLQCSVVGVPHPYKQEVPKAFIVLKEGYRNMSTKREIKEYCKQNLSHFMIPNKFVYRKGLPKTKIGKVDFKSLQQDTGMDDDE